MDKDDKKYGTLSCDATNENESMDGSHSCIIGLIDALMELERRDAILIKAHLDIRFLDEGQEESFSEFNIDDSRVIIDNVSIERVRRFEELSDDSKKAAFKLLMEHEYLWLTEEEYVQFAHKFIELYSKIDGVDRYDERPGFDPVYIGDLNLCLESLSNKHYRVRCAGHRYMLTYYEKEVYGD